ncbi:group I intron-associated PD-(D/E)XK endonuclease [Halorussus amylolyticus]|uniref:group I intron-associated PD-(D/E)XK endonuclease n=1 Tax=Halorussus amylolyticus TaxID=1126242 RepID=UPI0010531752|nr:group I intron-associated PD-(D/E)XK endonuclease [Halorussus amylolyticus]
MVKGAVNTKDKGDETEAKVIHELISNGYSVSVPFGDNDKYDLVVDCGEGLQRIQCKTAWTNKPDTMRFNTHSQTTRDGKYHENTYDGDIDAFIVRYPKNERIYWVDIEEATGQKMELRFEGEIDHPSINWAEEYEFRGRIP